MSSTAQPAASLVIEGDATIYAASELFERVKAVLQEAGPITVDLADVAELDAAGVALVRYDGMPQDARGVMRGKAAKMGPDIGWFTDPAGNVISVLSD